MSMEPGDWCYGWRRYGNLACYMILPFFPLFWVGFCSLVVVSQAV